MLYPVISSLQLGEALPLLALLTYSHFNLGGLEVLGPQLDGLQVTPTGGETRKVELGLWLSCLCLPYLRGSLGSSPSTVEIEET